MFPAEVSGVTITLVSQQEMPSSPFSLTLCTHFVFKVALTPTFSKLQHDLSILLSLTLPDVSSKSGNAPLTPCHDSSPCTDLESHTPLPLQENTSTSQPQNPSCQFLEHSYVSEWCHVRRTWEQATWLPRFLGEVFGVVSSSGVATTDSEVGIPCLGWCLFCLCKHFEAVLQATCHLKWCFLILSDELFLLPNYMKIDLRQCPTQCSSPLLPWLFKRYLDWLQWDGREGGVRSGGLILCVCMAVHLCMCVYVCICVCLCVYACDSECVSMSMYNITWCLLILLKCVNDILYVTLWMSRIRPVHGSQLSVYRPGGRSPKALSGPLPMCQFSGVWPVPDAVKLSPVILTSIPDWNPQSYWCKPLQLSMGPFKMNPDYRTSFLRSNKMAIKINKILKSLKKNFEGFQGSSSGRNWDLHLYLELQSTSQR